MHRWVIFICELYFMRAKKSSPEVILQPAHAHGGLNTETLNYGLLIHWQMVTAMSPLLLHSWLSLGTPWTPPDPAANGLTLDCGR